MRSLVSMQELPEADIRSCRYVDACFEPAFDHVVLGCLSHGHTFERYLRSSIAEAIGIGIGFIWYRVASAWKNCALRWLILIVTHCLGWLKLTKTSIPSPRRNWRGWLWAKSQKESCNCSPPIQAPKTQQQFQSQLLRQDSLFHFWLRRFESPALDPLLAIVIFCELCAEWLKRTRNRSLTAGIGCGLLCARQNTAAK